MAFNVVNTANGPVINLTRGDYCAFEVTIYDSNGDIYTLEEGDTVTLTVKKSTKVPNILIQKVLEYDDDLEFQIFGSDTNKLDYGTYMYDIQLTYANGNRDTFIGPCKFNITEEVNFG